MDVEGDHNEKIDPEPTFIVAPYADDGDGTHYLNGITKRWEIDGKQYSAIGGIIVDTSQKIHRISLNGQFAPKLEITKSIYGKDSVLQPNRKDLSAFLQIINFKFDSLALSETDQVVRPDFLNGSEVSFQIKRSIYRQLNGKKVLDTLSERISLKRDDLVKGIVTARFKHLPNNPILHYRYQSVLEINFSLTINLEREPLNFSEYPIRGRVRVYFNYGELSK